MRLFHRNRPDARPAALLVVQIECQDCAIDGAERQLLGPNGSCHRCGSGSFVYVGAPPPRHTIDAALDSITKAEKRAEIAARVRAKHGSVAAEGRLSS